MNNVFMKIWNALVKCDGETVARAVTNYFGNGKFDQDFYDFLVDEGIADEDEEEDGDE